jgi:Ni,Fe-hydrogenase III small subunit/NAD-dependent dihydropyrimidine dehydrogenase PreA subunit
MLSVLTARLKQGFRTMPYPATPPVLPDRLRGLPTLNPAHCPPGCQACSAICPTGAILGTQGELGIDLGRCLFCGACERVCPGAIRFTNDHRLAVSRREDLLWRGGTFPLAGALSEPRRSLYQRSFKIRQVSAGGCNACEADFNVLGTIGFDLSRFGIQVVASPRHADAVLVTGPVPRQMKLALEKTLAGVPTPRVVIAVGSCAIAGGPFIDHPEVNNGAGGTTAVDLFIPGCPPHPLTILDGLLRLLGTTVPEPNP